MTETREASQDGEARGDLSSPRHHSPWGSPPQAQPARRRMAPQMAPWKIGFLVALVFIAMIAAGLGQERIKWHADRARGEALPAGQVIEGKSGLYTLTLPDEGWVRVPEDTIHEGADLSLFGQHDDHYLVTYVRCDSTSIDSRVEFRRERQRGALRALAITEERRLIPESGLPVSYALYAGKAKGLGGEEVSWVATVAKEDFLVEVIGSAGGDPEVLAAVKRLVSTLEIKEEAKACAS